MKKKNLLLLLLLTITSTVFSQTDDVPIDVQDDIPAAPIDSYIIVAIVLTLIFVLYHFHKSVTKNIISK